MKNLKTVVLYGVIALLCVAAFAGYVVKNVGKSTGTAAAATETTAAATADTQSETTAASSEAASEEPSAAKEDPGKLEHAREIMARSAAEPAPNPVVGIGRGNAYDTVTEEAIVNAGGLKDIVKPGSVVLIKPNICTLAEAGSPQITDYRAVQKVIDLVAQLGASRVIVAEGTIVGNSFDAGWLDYNKYGEIKGAELVNLNGIEKADCYELQPEKSLTGKALFIPKFYMDADVVISVAKLKTHFQTDAVVSLVLKNAYGVPSEKVYGGYGYKGGLHALGLKESIVDINKIRKPDFCVIEGIVGGEGYGPLNNTPVKSEIVFAGTDPVAVDTAALTFMGFKVEEVPHVKLAAEEKLGIAELADIRIVGADLKKVVMDFESQFKMMREN